MRSLWDGCYRGSANLEAQGLHCPAEQNLWRDPNVWTPLSTAGLGGTQGTLKGRNAGREGEAVRKEIVDLANL